MTGGVTTELFTADILDKDKFWNDELMNVNKLFLFGLAQMGGVTGERKGIIEQHAYSIMEAREIDNLRLLKIRSVSCLYDNSTLNKKLPLEMASLISLSFSLC